MTCPSVRCQPAIIAHAVAASGPVSPRVAAELGDGLFATQPDGDLVTGWRKLGGSGPAYAEMPLAWATDEHAAACAVTTQQAKARFACGPDVGRHLEVARQFADTGIDHLVAMNAGPDPDGFMDFFAGQLAEPLRALEPGDGVRDQG